MTDERQPGDVFRALFDQWRAVLPAADDWMRPFERAFTAQSAVGRTVELSMDAWRDLASTPPGPDWAAKAAKHAERIQRQVGEAVTEAATPKTDWPAFLAHLESLDPTGWSALGRMGSVRDADPTKLTALVWDAYEATFGRGGGAPLVGPGRDFTERLLRAFEAWAEWARAGAAYGEVVAAVWRSAIEAFLGELAARGGRGETPASLRESSEVFMAVAERVFVERFQTPEYIEAQTRALEAGLRYRQREEEVAEAVLRLGHVPSRSEVDGAHRRIHELKQEVRALREELRALREETRASRAQHHAHEHAMHGDG